MNKVGLIQKDDDYYVPEIYACYEGEKGPESPEWKLAFRKVKNPRPCPSIKFIGVWDTVGALGAPATGVYCEWLLASRLLKSRVAHGQSPRVDSMTNTPTRTEAAFTRQSTEVWRFF